MIKRCDVIIFLFSTIYFSCYSSCLLAESYNWILETGGDVGHSGLITLTKTDHRVGEAITSGSACEDDELNCCISCDCGYEMPGYTVYSEKFTLNNRFYESQPEMLIPSLFRQMLGDTNDNVPRIFTLDYTIESRPTVLRNIAAGFSCLFCFPFYCVFLKYMQNTFRLHRQSMNRQLGMATPFNLPHGMSMTEREVVYSPLRSGQRSAAVSFSSPSPDALIMSLFLANHEAQHWLNPLLNNTETVNLSRTVWIPELATVPMSANIQIQRHAQVVDTQPLSGVSPVIPSHHMRLNFPDNNDIEVIYHIEHMDNETYRVLAVTITAGEDSLRMEIPGYHSGAYRMPPAYQSLEQLPDIQQMNHYYLQPSLSSGRL